MEQKIPSGSLWLYLQLFGRAAENIMLQPHIPMLLARIYGKKNNSYPKFKKKKKQFILLSGVDDNE